MAGTVKIAGHQFKTWQVWTVGVGGALVTYLIWRQHQASTAAQAASASQVDPLTGLTDAQDIAQYGSVSAADAAFQSGAATGTASYGYGSTGYGGSVGAIGDYGTTLGYTSGGGYASNAAWDQAATAGLSSIGYSETDVANALGRYLGGLSLTADQQNIVSVALAEFGNPPSGALPIIAAGQGTATSGDTSTTTGTTTGTTTTGGTTTTTTGTTGTTASTATATVSGGHVVSVSNNDAVIAWTGHNAVKYGLKISGPGAINGHTATVTIAQATYSGLEAGHTYDVAVTPYNSAGKAGTTGTITFATKKG